jgi:hypothetical protein
MNRFFTVSSKNRAIAFSIVIMLFYAAFSWPTPSRAENLFVSMQFASKMELAAPLPGELTVADVRILNILRISYLCINDDDSPAQFNVTQGTVMWQLGNLTVQYATVVDNLGNSFSPINNDSYIMNPYHEAVIEPHSMYNLSLIVFLEPGAHYSSSFQAWAFSVHVGSILPVEVSITLPSNFSIPFYTVGANYSRNLDYKVLTWQKPPLKTLNLTAVFLPFLYNPETKSFKYVTDVSKFFPVAGSIKATQVHEFESLSEYNGLKVPQISELPVSFPAAGKDIQVVSVFDTSGKCNSTLEPLSEPTDANRGSYYVDFANHQVIVYPRARIYENHYNYNVSVTFDFGNEPVANITFGQLLPYEGSIVFKIINVTVTGDWKQNITQNTMVEFWLPEEAQPYSSNDYTIAYSNGRYSVRFVNASSELTSGTWRINFYIVRLYNFFFIASFSILCLVVILFTVCILHFGWLYAFLKKVHLENTVRKLALKLHLGNTLREFIPIALSIMAAGPALFYEFNILGDWISDVFTQKPVFTALLLTQLILWATTLVSARKWKFEQETTG